MLYSNREYNLLMNLSSYLVPLEYVRSECSRKTSQGNEFVGKFIEKRDCRQRRHDLIIEAQVGNRGEKPYGRCPKRKS